MDKKPLDQSLIQRAIAGARYIVSGVQPNGFFTPQQPIAPMAQDSAIGRQLDYRTGFNTNIQPKVTEGSGISYAQLRALADSLDILRLVIETRKDQIEAFKFEIVGKDEKEVPESKLNSIRDRLMQPTPEYEWSTWLRMILEDLFVLDAVAIYPRMTRGGDLYSLDLIDSALIKRVIDDGGRTPLPPDPAYQQILKGIPAVDYTSDELILRMRNPRTSRLYGFSQCEQIVMSVNIALRRQLTQLQFFTEGNVPEALASVPDTWNPDQVAQFQMYFDSLMTGNTAARSRLKFIPLDTSKVKETRDPKLKDEFDEWLARIVCYAFSVPVHPFVREVNRATAQTSKESAAQEGLKPLLAWVERLMNHIIVKYMGETEVEFRWQMLEDVDPLNQANIDKIYVESGIRTPNEIREDRGWEKIEEPIAPPVAAPTPFLPPEPTPAEKMHVATLDALGKLAGAGLIQRDEAMAALAKAMDRPAPSITMPDIHLGDTVVNLPEQPAIKVDVGAVSVNVEAAKVNKTLTVARDAAGNMVGSLADA